MGKQSKIMDCDWKKILIGVLSGIACLLCVIGGAYPDVTHTKGSGDACSRRGLFETCQLTDCADLKSGDGCKKLKTMDCDDYSGSIKDTCKENNEKIETPQGLYLVALLCCGIGMIVAIMACFCCGKGMLIGSAVLHLLSGLFFMACGAYMNDKGGDDVKKDDNTDWGYTFASCWLCWLLTWIIGGFSIFACMAEGGT